MRADWFMNYVGYDMSESNPHSPTHCMQFRSGQTVDMTEQNNPVENGRATYWLRQTAAVQYMLTFRRQSDYAEPHTYYTFELYAGDSPAKYALSRYKNGSHTWLISSTTFPGSLNLKDGNWHGLGVRFYTDVSYVRIEFLYWNGSEWEIKRSYDDPLASAILGVGKCGFRCANGSSSAFVDDYKIESVIVTGP